MFCNNVPNFKSCSRTYKGSDEQRGIANNTVMTTSWVGRNQDDLDFIALYSNWKFANKNKINTYCLACSDGSEPYSFAIALRENVPRENLHKYNPIIASDIDAESIRAAKTGKINLAESDLSLLNAFHVKSGKKYFTNEQMPLQIDNDILLERDRCYSYTPCKELRDSIIFKQADMLEQLKTIKDDGNSIILCRNVTPYLTDSYRQDLVGTLKEKLHNGSFVVLGEFDHMCNIEEFLLQKDFGIPAFKKINDNIYERKEPLEMMNCYPPAELDSNRVFKSDL